MTEAELLLFERKTARYRGLFVQDVLLYSNSGNMFDMVLQGHKLTSLKKEKKKMEKDQHHQLGEDQEDGLGLE
ncbi:hypothetical protein FEM48_Zijuj01G0255100 [Ziziphus jujuba var. spinosa]|uniref:Uncharacterized protein n=1 Tax=Ziziphus jujuba var. spinosa TaxID=714518 RepID=A0A978W4R3_ZIZJJ|nr:hypothetical protein FEM48_Zijuj01G0255100 [Ziziphus jujuba var. spinosa]